MAKAALAGRNYLEARKLVVQGLEVFPFDESLQRLSTLFAPPQVTILSSEIAENAPIGPTLSSQEKNQQWVRQHGATYRGLWVAVCEGQLIGSASSVKELSERVADLSRALVTKIF